MFAKRLCDVRRAGGHFVWQRPLLNYSEVSSVIRQLHEAHKRNFCRADFLVKKWYNTSSDKYVYILYNCIYYYIDNFPLVLLVWLQLVIPPARPAFIFQQFPTSLYLITCIFVDSTCQSFQKSHRTTFSAALGSDTQSAIGYGWNRAGGAHGRTALKDFAESATWSCVLYSSGG